MPELKPIFENDFQALLIHELQRIANSHEQMVAIAMEARNARMDLSAKLQEKLKQPFEGK